MGNILGFLGVELGLNTAAFKGGCDKATYAAKQFSGDLKKEFSQLGNSFTELGSQLGASFGPVGGIVSALMEGIGAMSSAIKTASSSNVPALMQLAGATAGVGAAATAAVAGYAALAVGGAHAIEELSRMSEKTGISIRDLQTLKAVGESVDVPLESMARGFRTFSRALVEGGEGTSRASIALHNLGVTAHDPYQALLQVADGISKIEDPSKRSADATALFGSRIGLSLLPVLEKGSAGVKEYGDLVDVFGGKIDKQAVARTEAWKKATVELSTAWDNLKIQATNFLPVITQSTDFVAKYIAAWAKGESATDWLKDAYSLISTGHVSLEVTRKQTEKDSGSGAAEKKEHDASAQKQADLDAIRVKEEALYNLEKEGGKAGAALKKAELEVSRAVADEDFAYAAQIQKTIPLLKEAADLEKKRNEALLALPKTTKTSIDEQAVTVLKAYGEAIKGLGPASSEVSRQQEVAAIVQKEYNKQVEQGIAGYPAAKAALQQYATAVNDASLANAAFAKSGEASKMLVEFSDKMKESTERARAVAEATSTIGKAQAALSTGLDKAKKALEAQGVAYNELLRSTTATDAEKSQAADLLERNTRLLLADTDALEKNKQAIADKISAEAITKQEQLTAKTSEYLTLLGVEPEWLAKAEAGARAEATAIGLEGAALQKFLDLKKQEATQQHNVVAPTEQANEKVNEPNNQLQSIAAQRAAILNNAAAWQTDALATKAATKELQNLNLQELELKAASGSTMAGIKAGFQQFVLETKTVGQAIQQNIVTALNGLNKSIATTIITGKNLGVEMKKVGEGIAESMIEAGLKMLESWLLTKLGMSAITKTTAATDAAAQIALNKAVGESAAGTAGAAGVASFAAAPWPIDMGAPAFGASMFAAATAFNVAAYEGGGVVGETGMAMLHEKEMVLPRPISEKVQKMAESGSGSGNNGRAGRSTNVNMTVVTKDANSFKQSQGQIQSKAHLSATKMARRNGGQR